MDEGVVERGIDVSDTEHQLALSNLGTEGNGDFFLGDLDFLGRLQVHPAISKPIHPILWPQGAQSAIVWAPEA